MIIMPETVFYVNIHLYFTQANRMRIPGPAFLHLAHVGHGNLEKRVAVRDSFSDEAGN